MHIQTALVDAKQILGFGGVVHRQGWPVRDIVMVIHEARGIDAGEVLIDRCPLDHLAQPRRDDEMLNLNALGAAIFGDALEPVLHARK
ncbi:hypothetical protein D3C76_1429200 [compost metagenome]